MKKKNDMVISRGCTFFVREKRLLRWLTVVMVLISFAITLPACNRDSERMPQSARSDSDARKRNILAIANEISRLAVKKGEPIDEATRNKIRELVESLTSPKDIAALARTSRAFVIHDWPVDGKSDSDLEVIFDEAFWQCVKLLAANSNEDKRKQLERLKETSSLNDTESGYFTSIVKGKQFP